MYMKNIFRIMLLLTTMLFVSCGDDDEVKLPDTKDVNYANIAGSWRLSEWNGENLEGDTRYYYITFDRKGKDGKRIERSIYSRPWIKNVSGEIPVTIAAPPASPMHFDASD